MQNLHLLPAAQDAGMTKEQGDRLGLIHVRALIANNGGPALSKEDLKFALEMFDMVAPFSDFDEECRWRAECARKELQS